MNCYICSQPLDEIKIDPRDKKPRPCSNCELIIKEAVAEFDEGATELDYFADSTLEDIVYGNQGRLNRGCE